MFRLSSWESPERLTYSATFIYKERYDPLPYDITHSNAVYYVEEEDAVLVSSYTQCVIYKVDMATGELVWILGDPIGWARALVAKAPATEGRRDLAVPSARGRADPARHVAAL